MDLSAKIKGIKYKPLLCRDLEVFEFSELEKALASSASFILQINKENKVAISWWVSAKRTRSYPYARVYDTLGFSGKKITIIPIMKDEGKEGDRDFLQWDTVSLMSLLGIYVIIAYYNEAEPSKRYKNKITNQRFDANYLKEQIKNILSYQSDALHWNIAHIDNAGQIGQKALEAYDKISKKLKVEMHSRQSAEKRINELLRGKEEFMNLSRALAEKAQRRERLTVQPKENLSGTKAIITIQNYLGGFYYFTADEVEIRGNNVFLIEGKHSKTNSLPSLEDIKDGLLKMILFTNLEGVKADGEKYKSIAVLKLTVENHFNENQLSSSQKEILKLLRVEAKVNNFQIMLL
ncbi:MAG: hypothetical protein QHH13_03305 [Melioribacter sp.]|uniref:hypothetical protein n=1 Tax=Rosettibacter primus TaxID=3111523 RepID=UPI00247E52CE|nr:hypothetical protein [Melioribacter sp.]